MESKKKTSITTQIIDYYDVGGIETIDIIQSKLTKDQYIGFLRGNVIKYLCRAGYKSPETEASDYEKASYYSDLLAHVSK